MAIFFSEETIGNTICSTSKTDSEEKGLLYWNICFKYSLWIKQGASTWQGLTFKLF